LMEYWINGRHAADETEQESINPFIH
jgi:hypothetical protein